MIWVNLFCSIDFCAAGNAFHFLWPFSLCLIIFTEIESHIKPSASSGNQWKWRWSPEQCCYPHCCSRFSCPNPNSNPNCSSSSCSGSSPAHNWGTFFPFPSTARHLHHRDTGKCSLRQWLKLFSLALHIVLPKRVDFASVCNLQLTVHAELLPVVLSC